MVLLKEEIFDQIDLFTLVLSFIYVPSIVILTVLITYYCVRSKHKIVDQLIRSKDNL